MSLDVYLATPHLVAREPSGIFVRENGQTKTMCGNQRHVNMETTQENISAPSDSLQEVGMPRELLPCPFCGGPGFANSRHPIFCEAYWQAGCTLCNARLDVCFEDRPEAIGAWNTRAATQRHGSVITNDV